MSAPAPGAPPENRFIREPRQKKKEWRPSLSPLPAPSVHSPAPGPKILPRLPAPRSPPAPDAPDASEAQQSQAPRPGAEDQPLGRHAPHRPRPRLRRRVRLRGGGVRRRRGAVFFCSVGLEPGARVSGNHQYCRWTKLCTEATLVSDKSPANTHSRWRRISSIHSRLVNLRWDIRRKKAKNGKRVLWKPQVGHRAKHARKSRGIKQNGNLDSDTDIPTKTELGFPQAGSDRQKGASWCAASERNPLVFTQLTGIRVDPACFPASGSLEKLRPRSAMDKSIQECVALARGAARIGTPL